MSDFRAEYETLRRHGLSHEAASEAVAEGSYRCWCGSANPCVGGAQRYIGCPVFVGGIGEHTCTRPQNEVHNARPRGWRGRHMSGAAGWIVLALGLAFTVVTIVLACAVKP